MQKHEDENTTLAEMMNCVQELDYPTEESKKELIHESFKIDENRILNQDEKLEEETVKLFVDKFSGLAENLKHFAWRNRCFGILHE